MSDQKPELRRFFVTSAKGDVFIVTAEKAYTNNRHGGLCIEFYNDEKLIGEYRGIQGWRDGGPESDYNLGAL